MSGIQSFYPRQSIIPTGIAALLDTRPAADKPADGLFDLSIDQLNFRSSNPSNASAVLAYAKAVFNEGQAGTSAAQRYAAPSQARCTVNAETLVQYILGRSDAQATDAELQVVQDMGLIYVEDEAQSPPQFALSAKGEVLLGMLKGAGGELRTDLLPCLSLKHWMTGAMGAIAEVKAMFDANGKPLDSFSYGSVVGDARSVGAVGPATPLDEPTLSSLSADARALLQKLSGNSGVVTTAALNFALCAGLVTQSAEGGYVLSASGQTTMGAIQKAGAPVKKPTDFKDTSTATNMERLMAALNVVSDHFAEFDNASGGDTDGTISLNDITNIQSRYANASDARGKGMREAADYLLFVHRFGILDPMLRGSSGKDDDKFTAYELNVFKHGANGDGGLEQLVKDLRSGRTYSAPDGSGRMLTAEQALRQAKERSFDALKSSTLFDALDVASGGDVDGYVSEGDIAKAAEDPSNAAHDAAKSLLWMKENFPSMYCLFLMGDNTVSKSDVEGMAQFFEGRFLSNLKADDDKRPTVPPIST